MLQGRADANAGGYPSTAGDCGPLDSTVRPGAPQICDGQNNDCDHPSWPGLTGTNEVDLDGDVYTECNGDCAPLDGATYPSAPQVCDGVNNDCNHPDWPSVSGTNEADQEGDTYSECAGDCAPLDAGTYPGAIESSDGQDNQCPGDESYGMIDEISGNSGFHTAGDKSRYSWTPQPGAHWYQVARATAPDFSTGGREDGLAYQTYIVNWDTPVPGGIFYYLVRSRIYSAGSWGRGSNLVERVLWCAEEYDCSDGVDNDGDGKTDCSDVDCEYNCG